MPEYLKDYVFNIYLTDVYSTSLGQPIRLFILSFDALSLHNQQWLNFIINATEPISFTPSFTSSRLEESHGIRDESFTSKPNLESDRFTTK